MFIFLSSLLCAVTLLDSMSALADLGWEAYPNEGVSMCSTTHTHIHSHKQKNPAFFMPELAPQPVGFVDMFYFQGTSWDSEFEAALECVF